MSKFKLSKSSKNNLKGVRPAIIEIVDRVIKKTEHDFGIPQYGGLRTPQEQNNLYHKRDSKGRRITFLDGFKKKSKHQTGDAWDVFVYDEHGACWSDECSFKYDYLAELFKEEFCLMKKEGLFEENEILVWGGDWVKFIDKPHFQIDKYK